MHPAILQELFADLSNALVLYARGWCKNPEDAVQEAFIDLANCNPEPSSPKAWLYTTTAPPRLGSTPQPVAKHKTSLARNPVVATIWSK
ncbi:MAG: hypothetical protein MUC43_13265 [Pirellula sp.]|nr:hypothetical protein [Pirellula sp.]